MFRTTLCKWEQILRLHVGFRSNAYIKTSLKIHEHLSISSLTVMRDRGRRPLHVSSLTSMNHFDNDFLQNARHKSVIGVESPDIRVFGSSTLIDSVRVRSFCCSSLTARKVDESESNRNGDRLDGDVDANSEAEGGVKQTASTADETTMDEETLLAEYYRSYKEDVWTAGQDDERDVRWMEMLGKRGAEGVFDMEELLEVLKSENVQDIVCIRVPDDMKYTDYLLIGTGFSFRHLKSVMEYVKKLYKGKKRSKDPHVEIEGLDAEDWLVMDMGNIVLHLFQKEARASWDLETLWTVGDEFDERTLEGRQNQAGIESIVFLEEEELWNLDKAPL